MCKQLTDWFQPVGCPSLLFTVAALESLRFIVLVDCSEERAALQFLHQLEPSAGRQTSKQPRTAMPFHGDGSSESPHHYSAVYIAPVQFPTFPQGRLILASLALRLSVGTQTQLLPCTFCAASSRPCLLPCYAEALLAEGSFFICQKIRNWFHVEHGSWSG